MHTAAAQSARLEASLQTGHTMEIPPADDVPPAYADSPAVSGSQQAADEDDVDDEDEDQEQEGEDDDEADDFDEDVMNELEDALAEGDEGIRFVRSDLLIAPHCRRHHRRSSGSGSVQAQLHCCCMATGPAW